MIYKAIQAIETALNSADYKYEIENDMSAGISLNSFGSLPANQIYVREIQTQRARNSMIGTIRLEIAVRNVDMETARTIIHKIRDLFDNQSYSGDPCIKASVIINEPYFAKSTAQHHQYTMKVEIKGL